jgi:hypothetical protein
VFYSAMQSYVHARAAPATTTTYTSVCLLKQHQALGLSRYLGTVVKDLLLSLSKAYIM